MSLGITACGGADFAILTPIDGATGVDTMPYVSWNADKKATSYDVVISTNADFTVPTVVANGVEATAYQVVNALANDTKYYLAVKANGEGDYSKVVTSSFVTRSYTPYPDVDRRKDALIYDFDYASTEDMLSAWTVHGGGDPITAELIDSPLVDGGKALRYTYDNTGTSVPGWSQIYAQVPSDKYIWDG